MHTTNYVNTFILVSPDCPVDVARVPEKPGTIATLQYEKLVGAPYAMTSNDLIFAVFSERNGIAEAEKPAARAKFFSKGQPCLRSSPLVKTFGWGVHHDEEGRIALYGLDTPEYRVFAAREDLARVPGMRSKRG
ncbi:hypothetical protein GCM10010862_13380 [Devosia nitrariae]|uniref:Uncharacterized protein n=2 Tax=Devosia nitrariae TaxID=2071872 RepID=A0ABQ5W2I4_9HYPH|nr:hypothetical protein GCM10010862_13380 [Devosia nitrariae]